MKQKITKEELTSYQLAQKLRSALARCVRINADVALLCEHALAAAEWLEREADRVLEKQGALVGTVSAQTVVYAGDVERIVV